MVLQYGRSSIKDFSHIKNGGADYVATICHSVIARDFRMNLSAVFTCVIL